MNPDDPTMKKPNPQLIERLRAKVKKESVHVVRTSVKCEISHEELDCLILAALDLPEHTRVKWMTNGGSVSVLIDDRTEKSVP